MIPILPALIPYKGIAKIIGYVLLAVLAAALLWWAVGKPRVDLANEREAHSALKAAHADLLTKLSEAEAAAAVKSQEVQAAYDAGIAASAKMREKEIQDAYNRGRSTAAGIKSGAVSVRTVWRDRECAASAEGEGAGAGEGVAGVSGERADAIGRVLGHGGRWDATYAEAYRRLTEAQKIVDACYEEPAP